jgi:hypothetical protein
MSAATARSHCATSWQPAAVAIPFTTAITGWGRAMSLRIIALQVKKSASTLRAPQRDHLLQVMARAESRARPVIITTRTDSSAAMASSSE